MFLSDQCVHFVLQKEADVKKYILTREKINRNCENIKEDVKKATLKYFSSDDLYLFNLAVAATETACK